MGIGEGEDEQIFNDGDGLIDSDNDMDSEDPRKSESPLFKE